MYRVAFVGPRRARESLGHDCRDDALRFLAKNSASIVDAVRIVGPDGTVEHLPARRDAGFYLSQMAASSVIVPVSQTSPDISRGQAQAIVRLLGSELLASKQALRCMAQRFGFAKAEESDAVIRERLRELADRTLA